MSNGEDVLRIDPYWYEYNLCGSLEEYFQPYWDKLLAIEGARPHWGKHKPAIGSQIGTTGVTFDSAYIDSLYPGMSQWKAARAKYDPNQVFVTNYWRDLLGIVPKK
jgi:hypothetical protein